MEVFPGPGETHVEKRLHKKCLVINPGLDWEKLQGIPLFYCSSSCMKQTGRCTFHRESPEEEQQFGPHRFLCFLYFLWLHILNSSLNLHAGQIPHDLITDFRADLESECGILSLPSFHFSSVFLSSSPPSLCFLSSSLTPLLSSNLPPLSLPPGYTYPGIQLASCRPLSNFLLPVATAQSAKWWCMWSIAERGRRACLNLC